MMASKSKRYGIHQIGEVKDRKVFFDTNVLLLIFHEDFRNDPRNGKYIKLFIGILARRMEIFVKEIVLSEFYSFALKREREKSNFPSVKAFRDSEAGIEAREEIFGYMKAMLQQLNYIPSNLSLTEMTNQFTVDSLDYNDKLIAETCRKNDFVLVTDDADYMDTEIDVLSANTMFA